MIKTLGVLLVLMAFGLQILESFIRGLGILASPGIFIVLLVFGGVLYMIGGKKKK